MLTGGPGGGKTALARTLRDEDPNADRWLLVPEAATILLSAGLVQGQRAFQQEVVRLQIALESGIGRAGARVPGKPGRVHVCDRGTLDSLAYWRLGGWDEQAFFDLTGMDHAEHLRRYDGVIHLQSSAIEAGNHYDSGPHAGRIEPPEEAAAIDALCAEVWREHERYVLVENAGRDWPAKRRRAREVLARWLS